MDFNIGYRPCNLLSAKLKQSNKKYHFLDVTLCLLLDASKTRWKHEYVIGLLSLSEIRLVLCTSISVYHRLLKHEKTHQKRERAYKCDICDKAFMEEPVLVSHRKRHFNEVIPCRICGKKVSQQRYCHGYFKVWAVL